MRLFGAILLGICFVICYLFGPAMYEAALNGVVAYERAAWLILLVIGLTFGLGVYFMLRRW